jgi:urea transporter
MEQNMDSAIENRDQPCNYYRTGLDFVLDLVCSGDMKKAQHILTSCCWGERKNGLNTFAQLIVWLVLVIDIVLRGIAQVFLCNNPLSGIFICIGLSFTSVTMLGYAFLTTLLATFSAWLVGTPAIEDVLSGLCGYDGALVGCACFSFLDSTNSLTAAILLSLLSGVVHVACANILKVWSLPTFTFSFNIVTVLILLAIHGDVISLPLKTVQIIEHDSNWTNMSINFAVDASIRGVGQFMFADTTVGSAFVIAGIAIASRQGAAAATLGAIVGWTITYYVLGVRNVTAIRSGLYGYNCAGTCASLAGGVFFNQLDFETILIGIIGSCLCCLLTVGIIGVLSPIPCLTFPFIVTTWLMLITRTNHLKNKIKTDNNPIRVKSKFKLAACIWPLRNQGYRIKTLEVSESLDEL